MNCSFSVNTKKGGTLVVSLLSSYEFLKQVVDQKRFANIEVTDISISREDGNGVISIDVLKMVASQISKIVNQQQNVILFYFCDSSMPIPAIRNTRTISEQEYRDKLFSLMFERYANLEKAEWNDYRIEVTVGNEPQFAHLLYRTEHKETIDDISKEIRNTISEIEHQK